MVYNNGFTSTGNFHYNYNDNIIITKIDEENLSLYPHTRIVYINYINNKGIPNTYCFIYSIKI